MSRLLAVLAAVACVVASLPAAAQDWPTKPVRIIIPLGPGGGGDVFARLLGEELQKRLGQPFVVENRAGGAMNIGMRACAEAPPDGYTYCITSSEPVTYNQFLYKNQGFDPETAFEPVTLLFFNPLAISANAKLGVKSIPELIALSKAKPGTLSYSTFSIAAQVFMDKLKKTDGADFVYVPYRSGNEVVNAAVSGSTPIMLLGLANMLSQIRAGIITVMAVNAYKRSPLFPDVPTLKEVHGEDFPSAWFGMFAPHGTPKPIIAKLHAEIVSVTNDPAFRQKNFVDRAIDYAVGPTDEFVRFIAEDRRLAKDIVEASGQKPQ